MDSGSQGSRPRAAGRTPALGGAVSVTWTCTAWAAESAAGPEVVPCACCPPCSQHPASGAFTAHLQPLSSGPNEPVTEPWLWGCRPAGLGPTCLPAGLCTHVPPPPAHVSQPTLYFSVWAFLARSHMASIWGTRPWSRDPEPARLPPTASTAPGATSPSRLEALAGVCPTGMCPHLLSLRWACQLAPSAHQMTPPSPGPPIFQVTLVPLKNCPVSRPPLPP